MINLKSEAQGFYTLRLGTLDADGNEVDCYEPVPTFPNLITNGGLERMGDNGDWLSRTYVGSGSAVPNFNDSAMNNFVASTGAQQSSVKGAQSSEPYFTWIRITRRFSAGQAAGNLSEVGIGWLNGLFSRALIVDADGNPTTITVGADQFLDVTYEFRFYPKTTDDTGTFTLAGNLGGTYDYVLRPSNVTSNNSVLGWYLSAGGTSMDWLGATSAGRKVYSGAIGSITETPSGSSIYATNLTASAYEASSHTRKVTMTLGLDAGNFETGIKSAFFILGIGAFQAEFTPAILKTNERLLNLEFSHSWGRRA